MGRKVISNYPVYFTSINCEYSQEPVFRANGMGNEQLMFVISGEAFLTLDGKEYHLYPNTAVYFSKDVPHSYRGIDGNFKDAWITFDGEILSFFHRYFNVGKALVCYDVDISRYISVMKELECEYKANAEESVMSSILYRLLTEFFSSNRETEKTAMENAELYIIRNFSEKIYLDELCRITGFSKSKFCSMAKQYWGKTAFEVIMDTRLSYAVNLLKNNPGIKLSECAQMCGFEDVSYFCKCYRKKYGVSPKNAKCKKQNEK